MEIFTIIYRINLRHDYYQEGSYCKGVELSPTVETLDLLRRRGVLFRKENEGVWVLIAPGNNPFNDETELRFTLKIQDPVFYYFTKEEEEHKRLFGGEPISISISGKKSGDQKFPENNVFFYAKELYWEYIFIPRQERELTLLFQDMSKHIDFDQTVENSFMDRKAFRFISRQKVKLQEYYTHNLTLFEATSYGNRLLLKNIVAPYPGRILCADPNRIQTIVYI